MSAPFACTFHPRTAELLWDLQCSLVISTYQAGKVIFLSPKPAGAGIYELPRTFDKPMGLAVADARLAVATRNRVVVLANAPGLAAGYPKQPNTYDGLYLPRATYNTGELDVHDLAFVNDQLVAANTRFSCLSRIEDRYSATPFWKPPFIKELTPDDHCHLNGVAVDEGGEIKYVTALGETDTAEGWRENKLQGGVLLAVDSGERILGGLGMPHSPRVYDGKLYLLLSCSAALACVDVDEQRYETVTELPGFARGLARQGDYLFAGISRLRPHHKFGDLPIAKRPPFCGVVIIHLPTGGIAGSIGYATTCEEIYDVQVLPGLLRPGILRLDDPFVFESLSMPDKVYWGKREGES